MKRILQYYFLLVLFVGIFSCSNDAESSIQNSAFVGTWNITSIQVSSDDLEQQPASGDAIQISFLNNGSFSGDTERNTFSGRYEISGSTLTMLEFDSTTDTTDTPYAGEYFRAIAAANEEGTTTAVFTFNDSEERTIVLNFFGGGFLRLER